MRFRCRSDLRAFTLFRRVASALNAVSERAACEHSVLHFTPKRVQFMVKSDDVEGAQSFAELESKIFWEYRVESRAENCISLRLRLPDLLRATRSGERAYDSITMKLTKRGSVPCLTILARTENKALVEQDVPVQPLTPEEFRKYREPEVARLDVNIPLPDLANLRCVCLSMQQLAKHITVKVFRSGRLEVCVEAEQVCARTIYGSIDEDEDETESDDDDYYDSDDNEAEAGRKGASSGKGKRKRTKKRKGGRRTRKSKRQECVSVLVDARRLTRAFGLGNHIGADSMQTICCVSRDHAFILYTSLAPLSSDGVDAARGGSDSHDQEESAQSGYVTIYLPVLNIGSD